MEPLLSPVCGGYTLLVRRCHFHDFASDWKGTSETKRRRGGKALRASASWNGPFGCCQVESFENSFADSVSFLLPSWHSLDGPQFLRRIALQAMPLLRRKFAENRKAESGQAAYKPVPLTLRIFRSASMQAQFAVIHENDYDTFPCPIRCKMLPRNVLLPGYAAQPVLNQRLHLFVMSIRGGRVCAQ